MQILFITSSRIGDAVLSTGLLNYINQNYKNAKVTIVCGPLASSLFEGYPNLERIIPLKKQRYHRHWIGLWRQVAVRRWDLVIDIRNSAVSRLIRARQRYIYGPHIDSRRHKVEQAAAIMNLADVPSPKLWPSLEQAQRAAALIPETRKPVIGVGPAANWRAKTWPAERFVQVIEYLRTNYFPDSYVAVFAAPGEENAAYQVLNSFPQKKQINVIAKADPGTVAAALSNCDFYIGNDSGLMHSAAALDVPTFGLFGPSYPQIYGPWGESTAYAATPETFDELIDYEGYSPQTAPCLMTTLTFDMVIEKLDIFLTRKGKKNETPQTSH